MFLFLALILSFLKCSKLRAFALEQFVFQYSIDAASARSLAQRSLQLSQQIGFASGHNLNVSLIGVPHPAAQTKLSRLPLHKPAKANSLNSALDEEMQHHGSLTPC